MVSIYESIMAASLIVGLMSVPAASESLNPGETIEQSLDQVSTEEIPEQVVKETSSDSFYRSVESAFGEFNTEIESDGTEITLENPSSRLEIDEQPGEKTWHLTRSEAEMEKVQTPNKNLEIVRTPEGTLRKEKTGGETEVEFDGTDRDKVEEKADELHEVLDQKMEQIEKQQERMQEKAMPEFELEVDAEEEFVEIQNLQDREIDMTGWEIHDSTSNVYEFDTEIGPRETLTLYSHEGDDSENEVYWGYSEGYSVWSQSGDEATLYNQADDKIVQKSY